MRLAGANRVVVTNKQDFTSLGWLRGTWELEIDGAPAGKGKLPALKDNA